MFILHLKSTFILGNCSVTKHIYNTFIYKLLTEQNNNCIFVHQSDHVFSSLKFLLQGPCLIRKNI